MAFQFVFDLNHGTDCQDCAVGSWMEHRAEQGQNWRQVHSYNTFRHSAPPRFQLSLARHHCEGPTCLVNCPA